MALHSQITASSLFCHPFCGCCRWELESHPLEDQNRNRLEICHQNISTTLCITFSMDNITWTRGLSSHANKHLQTVLRAFVYLVNKLSCRLQSSCSKEMVQMQLIRRTGIKNHIILIFCKSTCRDVCMKDPKELPNIPVVLPLKYSKQCFREKRKLRSTD